MTAPATEVHHYLSWGADLCCGKPWIFGAGITLTGQMQDCLHGHELHINSAIVKLRQVAVQVHIISFKACFSMPEVWDTAATSTTLCIMNNFSV